MDKRLVASELIKVAQSLLAIDFPTDRAMQVYLKEHPDADKRNHKVVKTKPEENKSKSGTFDSHTDAWFDDVVKTPHKDDEGITEVNKLITKAPSKENFINVVKALGKSKAPWKNKVLQHAKAIVEGKFSGEFARKHGPKNQSSQVGEFFSMLKQAINYDD
jgi:hypothetical protein